MKKTYLEIRVTHHNATVSLKANSVYLNDNTSWKIFSTKRKMDIFLFVENSFYESIFVFVENSFYERIIVEINVDFKFVKWLVRKNRALSMSKNDDELNEFVDEVTDGVYNLPCVDVILKLVKLMQAWGDERIKKIIVLVALGRGSLLIRTTLSTMNSLSSMDCREGYLLINQLLIRTSCYQPTVDTGGSVDDS